MQAKNFRKAGWITAALVGALLVASPAVADKETSTGQPISEPLAALGVMERVSLANDGSQGNGASGIEGIPTGTSLDGRYTAFYSFASNLAAGDLNGHPDIFLRDAAAGTTTLLSRAYTGGSGNGPSTHPSISADGNVVAFISDASNLVPDDTNSQTDVFIYTRQTGVLTRLAVGNLSFGTEAPWISGNGRYVVFYTYASLLPADTNGVRDIYTFDIQESSFYLASSNASGTVGNGHSFDPHISHDGRYVVFHTMANNLVGSDTNNYMDVMVKDRSTGAIAMASLSAGGAQGNNNSLHPTVSDDGRFVAFESLATNLVPGDTNNRLDVFIRDMAAGTIVRASVTSNGTQGTAHSRDAYISGSGRFVAFQSDSQLTPQDTQFVTDVYVYSREGLYTELISKAASNAPGSSYSHKPMITQDGRFVVFGSYANNLVPGDTNGWRDVFLRDRTPACSAEFTDVLPGSSFYPYVRCLACRDVLGGYPDGTFRPNSNATRGQLSKIISNAAGFVETRTIQTFADVPNSNPFYQYIERMAARGIIGGYPCGGPGEPCGVGSKPYFRPNNNATRGQIAKIVSSAARFDEPVGAQMFEDVAPGTAFFDFVQRLAGRAIIGGYPCGGSGEPCGASNLPYFRPGSNATRGQIAKIVSSAFFPECTR